MAEAVDAFSRRPFRDSSGEAHAGLVTGEDMAAFSATWEEPATYDWQGYSVAKTQAWGQGPALLQSLAVLDALDDPAVLDPSTADGIHAVAEVLKLVLRRPRGLVRRRRRRPAEDAAVPVVRRGAGRPGRGARLARGAPGAPGRARAAAPGVRAGPGAPGGRAGGPDDGGADGGAATA